MHSSKKRAHGNHSTHKETTSDVLMSRCSKNMQQVYKETFTPRLSDVKQFLNSISGAVQFNNTMYNAVVSCGHWKY